MEGEKEEEIEDEEEEKKKEDTNGKNQGKEEKIFLEKINKILKPFIKLTKRHKEKNKLIKIVMKEQNSNTEKRLRKFSV